MLLWLDIETFYRPWSQQRRGMATFFAFLNNFFKIGVDIIKTIFLISGMIETPKVTHYGDLAEGHVILFAEEGNDHYGDIYYELKTKLPEVSDELVAFAAEYYSVDEDEARELVDPSDIVDTAGAWDDVQFVSDLWQAMEAGEVKGSGGFRTQDGAVVIDIDAVELTKKEAE